MSIERRLELLGNQGIEAYKRKQYAASLDAFTELRRLVPSDERAIYFTALSLIRLEQKDSAIPHLKKLANEAKNSFYRLQGHMLLGYLFATSQRGAESDLELQALLRENYENPQVYSILGYNAYQRKDFPQAEYYYRKALELDPENANAHNGLGCTYLEWTGRSEKALPHIETALRIAPGTPSYLDSLGWFHFLKQNVAKAMFFLKKALRLKPHREIADHLKSVEADQVVRTRMGATRGRT